MRQQLRGRYEQKYAEGVNPNALRYSEDQFPGASKGRGGGSGANEADYKYFASKQEENAFMENLSYLYNGTPAQKMAAAKAIGGLSFMDDPDVTDRGVTFYVKDANGGVTPKYVSFYDQNNEELGVENFVYGAYSPITNKIANTQDIARNVRNKGNLTGGYTTEGVSTKGPAGRATSSILSPFGLNSSGGASRFNQMGG
jgi:hypothetical protein